MGTRPLSAELALTAIRLTGMKLTLNPSKALAQSKAAVAATRPPVQSFDVTGALGPMTLQATSAEAATAAYNALARQALPPTPAMIKADADIAAAKAQARKGLGQIARRGLVLGILDELIQ